MTLQVRLVREDRVKNDFFRTVEMRTGSGPWSTFLPTWRNDLELPSNPLKNWAPVSEIYVKVTLDQLREIDGDKELQTRFITQRLKPVGETTGLPVLRLCLKPGQKVSDKDIQ